MLAPGTTLGPYEIQALLGAGGMGEVYKARDTRLDRIVAIKVLPAHLADNPDLRERFEREARTIAGLNHPHICTLHDIGRQDGIDFLVMEYLEGETLSTRLLKGPLPLEQALRYAIEIADALDKAHRKGVTHRDLKPGNLMLTKSGSKLLDFGLAKLKQESAPPPVPLSQLPTLGPTAGPAAGKDSLTVHGTVLGTVQYMAPEQVEGKTDELDARTDIFAFGAVVYEMATGKKAFAGKTHASIMAKILETEPPPMSSLQPMAPPALDQLVRTCLAKDPDERWQSAADLVRPLKWILEGGSQIGVAQLAVARRRHARTVVAATAGCLLGALLAGLLLWFVNRPEPPAPQRLSITLPADRPIAFSCWPCSSLAISPDGTKIAYVGPNPERPTGPDQGMLYIRSLQDLTIRPLPGTAGASQPFFSPDGQWLAFLAFAGGKGGLKKVSLAGGDPVTLLENVSGARYAVFGAWIDADTIVFAAPGSGGLRRISADGGPPQQLTTLDSAQGESGHSAPDFVPGTNAVLFHVGFTGLRDSRIEAVNLDTGERRVILENADWPHYLTSGHLLFQRDENILVAPFDPAQLAITESAVPLIDEVRRDGAAEDGNLAQLAVSRNGTLAYVPSSDQAERLGWVTRNGTFRSLPLSPNRFDYPSISPDGQHLAVEIKRGREGEVHIYDFARGTISRLTQDGSDRWPSWHPDGRRLAVWSSRQDGNGIYLKDLGGTDRLLLKGQANAAFRQGSWSPDGKLLAYTIQSGSQHDIWILSLDGEPVAKPLLNTAASEHSPRFSPDGRWLAYVSNESGASEVYLRSYPQGGRIQLSTGGGIGPVWGPGGREIFYQGPHEGVRKLMAVRVTPDRDTLRPGTPAPLFDMRVPTPAGVIEEYARSTNGGPRYDVSSDGQRFLMIRGPDPEGTREIVLILNWFEELKRRLSPAVAK